MKAQEKKFCLSYTDLTKSVWIQDQNKHRKGVKTVCTDALQFYPWQIGDWHHAIATFDGDSKPPSMTLTVDAWEDPGRTSPVPPTYSATFNDDDLYAPKMSFQALQYRRVHLGGTWDGANTHIGSIASFKVLGEAYDADRITAAFSGEKRTSQTLLIDEFDADKVYYPAAPVLPKRIKTYKSIHFNGARGYVKLPPFDLPKAFTLEMLFQFHAQADARTGNQLPFTLLSFNGDASSNANGAKLLVQSYGQYKAGEPIQIQVRYVTQSPVFGRFAVSDPMVSPGTWHHIAVSVSSDLDMHVRLDGILVSHGQYHRENNVNTGRCEPYPVLDEDQDPIGAYFSSTKKSQEARADRVKGILKSCDRRMNVNDCVNNRDQPSVAGAKQSEWSSSDGTAANEYIFGPRPELRGALYIPSTSSAGPDCIWNTDSIPFNNPDGNIIGAGYNSNRNVPERFLNGNIASLNIYKQTLSYENMARLAMGLGGPTPFYKWFFNRPPTDISGSLVLPEGNAFPSRNYDAKIIGTGVTFETQESGCADFPHRTDNVTVCTQSERGAMIDQFKGLPDGSGKWPCVNMINAAAVNESVFENSELCECMNLLSKGALVSLRCSIPALARMSIADFSTQCWAGGARSCELRSTQGECCAKAGESTDINRCQSRWARPSGWKSSTAPTRLRYTSAYYNKEAPSCVWLGSPPLNYLNGPNRNPNARFQSQNTGGIRTRELSFGSEKKATPVTFEAIFSLDVPTNRSVPTDYSRSISTRVDLADANATNYFLKERYIFNFLNEGMDTISRCEPKDPSNLSCGAKKDGFECCGGGSCRSKIERGSMLNRGILDAYVNPAAPECVWVPASHDDEYANMRLVRSLGTDAIPPSTENPDGIPEGPSRVSIVFTYRLPKPRTESGEFLSMPETVWIKTAPKTMQEMKLHTFHQVFVTGTIDGVWQIWLDNEVVSGASNSAELGSFGGDGWRPGTRQASIFMGGSFPIGYVGAKGFTNALGGRVAVVRVHKKALNPTEVTKIHNGTRSFDIPGSQLVSGGNLNFTRFSKYESFFNGTVTDDIFNTQYTTFLAFHSSDRAVLPPTMILPDISVSGMTIIFKFMVDSYSGIRGDASAVDAPVVFLQMGSPGSNLYIDIRLQTRTYFSIVFQNKTAGIWNRQHGELLWPTRDQTNQGKWNTFLVSFGPAGDIHARLNGAIIANGLFDAPEKPIAGYATKVGGGFTTGTYGTAVKAEGIGVINGNFSGLTGRYEFFKIYGHAFGYEEATEAFTEGGTEKMSPPMHLFLMSAVPSNDSDGGRSIVSKTGKTGERAYAKLIGLIQGSPALDVYNLSTGYVDNIPSAQYVDFSGGSAGLIIEPTSPVEFDGDGEQGATFEVIYRQDDPCYPFNNNWLCEHIKNVCVAPAVDYIAAINRREFTYPSLEKCFTELCCYCEQGKSNKPECMDDDVSYSTAILGIPDTAEMKATSINQACLLYDDTVGEATGRPLKCASVFDDVIISSGTSTSPKCATLSGTNDEGESLETRNHAMCAAVGPSCEGPDPWDNEKCFDTICCYCNLGTARFRQECTQLYPGKGVSINEHCYGIAEAKPDLLCGNKDAPDGYTTIFSLVEPRDETYGCRASDAVTDGESSQCTAAINSRACCNPDGNDEKENWGCGSNSRMFDDIPSFGQAYESQDQKCIFTPKTYDDARISIAQTKNPYYTSKTRRETYITTFSFFDKINSKIANTRSNEDISYRPYATYVNGRPVTARPTGDWQHEIVTVSPDGNWTYWSNGEVVGGGANINPDFPFGNPIIARPGKVSGKIMNTPHFTRMQIGGKNFAGQVARLRTYSVQIPDNEVVNIFTSSQNGAPREYKGVLPNFDLTKDYPLGAMILDRPLFDTSPFTASYMSFDGKKSYNPTNLEEHDQVKLPDSMTFPEAVTFEMLVRPLEHRDTLYVPNDVTELARSVLFQSGTPLSGRTELSYAVSIGRTSTDGLIIWVVYSDYVRGSVQSRPNVLVPGEWTHIIVSITSKAEVTVAVNGVAVIQGNMMGETASPEMRTAKSARINAQWYSGTDDEPSTWGGGLGNQMDWAYFKIYKNAFSYAEIKTLVTGTPDDDELFAPLYSYNFGNVEECNKGVLKDVQTGRKGTLAGHPQCVTNVKPTMDYLNPAIAGAKLISSGTDLSIWGLYPMSSVEGGAYTWEITFQPSSTAFPTLAAVRNHGPIVLWELGRDDQKSLSATATSFDDLSQYIQLRIEYIDAPTLNSAGNEQLALVLDYNMPETTNDFKIKTAFMSSEGWLAYTARMHHVIVTVTDAGTWTMWQDGTLVSTAFLTPVRASDFTALLDRQTYAVRHPGAVYMDKFVPFVGSCYAAVGRSVRVTDTKNNAIFKGWVGYFAMKEGTTSNADAYKLYLNGPLKDENLIVGSSYCRAGASCTGINGCLGKCGENNICSAISCSSADSSTAGVSSGVVAAIVIVLGAVIIGGVFVFKKKLAAAETQERANTSFENPMYSGTGNFDTDVGGIPDGEQQTAYSDVSAVTYGQEAMYSTAGSSFDGFRSPGGSDNGGYLDVTANDSTGAYLDVHGVEDGDGDV